MTPSVEASIRSSHEWTPEICKDYEEPVGIPMKEDDFDKLPHKSNRVCHVGDCQNYGPFLSPYYNMGPNTGPNLEDLKRDHNFDNPPCCAEGPNCMGEVCLRYGAEGLQCRGRENEARVWRYSKVCQSSIRNITA